MVANFVERTHVVDKTHHNWVPTEDIAQKLKDTYPDLKFPWLEKEHIHGVNSVVHGVCEQHSMVVPMHLGNLWREVTIYGCPECAWAAGESTDMYKRFRNAPGYVGRSKMEFNIFCAVKAVWPDAVAGHKMVGRKEIDIWVPSIHAGIEYNGNFYHAETMGRGRTYHLDKSVTAWKQEKFIFHVFTEEADDTEKLVRMLGLFDKMLKASKAGVFNYPGGLFSQSISSGVARGFHRDWNFIEDFQLETCDFHFGVFDKDFNMVAAFSGVRKYGAIIRVSYAIPGLPLAPILKWAKAGFKVPSISIRCNSRNPLEWALCRGNKDIVLGLTTEPVPILLGSRYEMLDPKSDDILKQASWVNQPHPEETTRAWDCGYFWGHLKSDKPGWMSDMQK